MPRVVLITIGNEILKGHTLDTNVHFLSQKLSELGVKIVSRITTSDDVTTLKNTLKSALTLADWVVCTGGLGPTCDDLTKQVAADLMGEELVYHEEVACDIQKRFGDIPSIKEQAMLPKGAELFPNLLGTAYGIVLKKQNHRLILLPGVPTEMEQMAEKELFPFLIKQMPPYHRQTKELYLTQKNEGQVDPFLRLLQNRYPAVNIGIYPHYGYLIVRFESEQPLEPIIADMHSEFKEYIYSSQDGSIEGAVHECMSSKGLTLSLAESCTGGRIAAKLARIPGASEYFLGSIVSYSNQVKQDMLHVSQSTLSKFGAVSLECVEEMARGAQRLMHSEYALAVSGIAGPTGGSVEKPVGTVYFALAIADRVYAKQVPMKNFNHREVILEMVSNYVLGALYRRVEYDSPL